MGERGFGGKSVALLRICNGEKTNLLLRGEQSQRVMSKIVDHYFVALNSLDVDDGIEKTNFPHFDGHDNSGKSPSKSRG